MAQALFYLAALLILAFSTPSFASDHEASNREKRAASTCPKEYAKIPGHTMCMRDSRQVKKSGVLQQERDIILRAHNTFRSKVSPTATDLTALVWDEKLAAVAQKWAKQCVPGHDKERSVPSLEMFVGQNMAWDFDSWETVITVWNKEGEHFKYGPQTDNYLVKGGWKNVRNYTQIVANSTYLVGCGFAQCNTRNMYFCNYGQQSEQHGEPYTKGTSCSACPKHCKNKLCECKGLVCKHLSKLNLRTCTCDCRKPWRGTTCNDLNCPPKDQPFCGRGSYTPVNCYFDYSIPLKCPRMCGLCPYKG